MKYLNLLMRFWLTEKEAKTYLTLLESGPLRISSLAGALGLHRAEVYRIIPNMLEKGIILRSISGKTVTYIASDPEKLEGLLQDLHQDFSAVLPDLRSKFSKKRSEDRVEIYDGNGAIARLYEDIGRTLPVDGVYYRYTSRSDENRKNGDTYVVYKKLREEKRIRRLVIMSESGLKHKKADKDRGIVTVPSRFDAFDDNFQKIIFGNKIALVDLLAERAYVIENVDLAKFETKLFKFLYKFLKEYQD